MDEAYYLAMRVSELPVPYVLCQKGKCSECEEEVWLDENARRIWESMPILCMTCIEVYIKEKPPEEIDLMITPEIRESVENYFKRKEKLMKK